MANPGEIGDFAIGESAIGTATGDSTDLLARLKRVLPAGWFGPDGSFPQVEAVLAGAASVLAFVYSLWAFAKLQTRIATATGGWLELAANDFVGDMLRRFPGETDPAYSRRIRLEVLRDRNTRGAIDRAVFDLTGQHPDIYEAWRPADCGGLGSGSLALGVAGRLGSRGAPFEVIISMAPLANYGLPNWPGLGAPVAGLGFGFPLATDADLQGSGPAFTDVLVALERVRTAAITHYVRLVQLGDPNP